MGQGADQRRPSPARGARTRRQSKTRASSQRLVPASCRSSRALDGTFRPGDALYAYQQPRLDPLAAGVTVLPPALILPALHAYAALWPRWFTRD
jgi:hypothetical protein